MAGGRVASICKDEVTIFHDAFLIHLLLVTSNHSFHVIRICSEPNLSLSFRCYVIPFRASIILCSSQPVGKIRLQKSYNPFLHLILSECLDGAAPIVKRPHLIVVCWHWCSRVDVVLERSSVCMMFWWCAYWLPSPYYFEDPWCVIA